MLIGDQHRSDAVLECAKQLEFLVMSYSVSNAGYRERKAARIVALKQIAKGEGAVFVEDNTPASTSKGKGRAGVGTPSFVTGSEEAEEVVKILRSLIQRWAARNAKGVKDRERRHAKSKSQLSETGGSTLFEWDLSGGDDE